MEIFECSLALENYESVTDSNTRNGSDLLGLLVTVFVIGRNLLNS